MMVKYYCPYCNPKYQFQKQSSKDTLICGLCGEDLVKKPFIKLNQIIALIAASSLLLPLIYTFIYLIKNQINGPSNDYQANSENMIIINDTISSNNLKSSWDVNFYKKINLNKNSYFQYLFDDKHYFICCDYLFL